VCGVQRTGGDQRGCVVQMSFGGNHAKEASDQVQKKLQEEAMADEKGLEKALAGMSLRDDDGYSSDDAKYYVPGKKPADEEPDDEKPAWLEAYGAGVKTGVSSMSKDEIVEKLVEAQQKNISLEQQLKKARTEPVAKTEPVAEGSGKKKKYDPAGLHDKVINDPVVKDVIEGMKELQERLPAGLWWSIQWGDELMRRFKKDTGTYDDKDIF